MKRVRRPNDLVFKDWRMTLTFEAFAYPYEKGVVELASELENIRRSLDA